MEAIHSNKLHVYIRGNRRILQGIVTFPRESAHSPGNRHIPARIGAFSRESSHSRENHGVCQHNDGLLSFEFELEGSISRSADLATRRFPKRETGIEPATDSLGNWTAIENKDASRLWCSFRTTKNPTRCLSPFEPCLNAAEMRQSFASKEFVFF
jgi:hypothetical protein